MVILAEVLVVLVRFFFELLVEACSSILLLLAECRLDRSGQVIPQPVKSVIRETHQRILGTQLGLRVAPLSLFSILIPRFNGFRCGGFLRVRVRGHCQPESSQI